jgi:hypothetical protein
MAKPDREETSIDLLAEIRETIREGFQLLAVVALYKGADEGMAQDAAVARVHKIVKAIDGWACVGGLALNDALVCPSCDRVKLAGSTYYSAQSEIGFSREGAKLITCPECKAKQR